jgi:bifunctional pyridoxal-dependent enzyme with beta-cystathionase and maltose regulon repressor activities
MNIGCSRQVLDMALTGMAEAIRKI